MSLRSEKPSQLLLSDLDKPCLLGIAFHLTLTTHLLSFKLVCKDISAVLDAAGLQQLIRRRFRKGSKRLDALFKSAEGRKVTSEELMRLFDQLTSPEGHAETFHSSMLTEDEKYFRRIQIPGSRSKTCLVLEHVWFLTVECDFEGVLAGRYSVKAWLGSTLGTYFDELDYVIKSINSEDLEHHQGTIPRGNLPHSPEHNQDNQSSVTQRPRLYSGLEHCQWTFTELDLGQIVLESEQDIRVEIKKFFEAGQGHSHIKRRIAFDCIKMKHLA